MKYLNFKKTKPLPGHIFLYFLGTVVAFDPAIHNARPHPGQLLSAKRMRSLLHSEKHPSEIAVSHKNCGEVQDAYTLRCSPQVHGISHDIIKFVESILTTEMNSATDNPMVFSEDGRVLSGGNFHGEYPAKAMDILAIGVSEFGSISEVSRKKQVFLFSKLKKKKKETY